MFDMSRLITLSAALEQSITDRDIDQIQQLCEDNNCFILTIEPLDDPAANEKIKTLHIGTSIGYSAHP